MDITIDNNINGSTTKNDEKSFIDNEDVNNINDNIGNNIND